MVKLPMVVKSGMLIRIIRTISLGMKPSGLTFRERLGVLARIF